MRPFDLQEYLKNPDRQIVTRGGRNARIICTDRNSDDHPIVALLQGPVCENTCFYRRDGLWLDDTETSIDLLFAPEKKSAWINLYKMNSIISPGPRVYDTKEEAESAAGDKSYYISTIKIEWEE